MSDMKNERELFEAWFTGGAPHNGFEMTSCGGGYLLASIQQAWRGWLGRAGLPAAAAVDAQDKKDAERYRWAIRNNVLSDNTDLPGDYWRGAENISEAIDAAIAQSKEQGARIMGEYADDYFRKEVMRKHGFDPVSMYSDNNKKPNSTAKVACKLCGKRVKFVGMGNHMKDVHSAQSKEPAC